MVFSYPCVALDVSGNVFVTRCTCEQKNGGRCCHIAAVLYLLEEISIGVDPRISTPCTSNPQAWGKGQKTKKDPGPVGKKDYGKKLSISRYNYDPRPKNGKKNKHHFDALLAETHGFKVPSNFSAVQIHYEDYEIDTDRKIGLSNLRDQYLSSLRNDLIQYSDDPLNTDSAVHITGSIDQGLSELWRKKRRYLITASKIYTFSSNPKTAIDEFWNETADLSSVPSISYGINNEKNAVRDFEESFGKILKCGLFVSRNIPFIGASPDGIFNDTLIEIKCPYILRNSLPDDLSGLTPAQKNSFCCIKTPNGLALRKTHQYYYQVQCQMYVTGYKKTLFII